MLLPHTLRRSLSRVIGRLLLSTNAKRNEIVQTNLEWTMPTLSDANRRAIAANLFAYFGQTMLEFGNYWWCSEDRFQRQFQIEGHEHLDALVAQNRRVIFITLHAVFIDPVGMALSRHYPMVAYVNKTRNPLMQWMMSKGRSRFGIKVLQRESGLRELVKNIKQGRIPYYVVDEDFGSKDSVFAPFFGVSKATLATTGRIAKMTDAVVVPVTGYFDDEIGKYRVVIQPALTSFPSGVAEADAATINQALESLIKLAPEQYMWTLRLFQTRPDGSPPPYSMKGKPGSGPRARPDDLSH